MMKNLFGVVFMLAIAFLVSAGSANAAMTLPTVATTDIEAAGTAVAGVVAVYALIKGAIRMYRGI